MRKSKAPIESVPYRGLDAVATDWPNPLMADAIESITLGSVHYLVGNRNMHEECRRLGTFSMRSHVRSS